MEKQTAGKGAAKNMEYLIRLLHKEWECSGRTKTEAAISRDDAPAVKKRMAEAILEKQKQLDVGEMAFEQSMELSKENFVLLRLIKKFKEAEEKGIGPRLIMELDREEYRLFRETAGPWAR